MFSKKEMEQELLEFIESYSQSVQRMFSLTAPEDLNPRHHTLFQICSALYDYAFLGLAQTDPQLRLLGDGYIIDGVMADAEMFLLGMEAPSLYTQLYYQEDNVHPPSMAVRTVQAAVARHVLYGGERYTTPTELGFASDCLSFSDIALLADMDEKSVRNAANPKNKDPLISTAVGRRTWITREDARKWLVKRRGFVANPGIDFPTDTD